MRIETLCTGDELLTGLTADTNSSFFQQRLLETCGLTVSRSTVVGDAEAELVEVFRALALRCDVVLVSGGLGPTTDDITVACAAKAFGVDVVEDTAVLEHIRRRFERRGVVLTANNRLQARVPRDSEAILNDEGSAPLIIHRHQRCTFFFVPGVPREYRHLVGTFVIPRLTALTSTTSVTRLRVLKTMGIPESHLDMRVQPLIPKHPLVTFGYRTHTPENHLKLLVHAATPEEAEQALTAAEREVQGLLGEAIFGVDADTLAGVVGRALVATYQTLAVAESCTGGLISAACTEIAGASDWFVGGAATYAVAAKAIWAKVDPAIIERFGVVSAEVARAMAEGVRQAVGTSCGLSVTGYAGPAGGDALNPVGTVFIGIATRAGVEVERHRFGGDRQRVREFAASTALDALRRRLG